MLQSLVIFLILYFTVVPVYQNHGLWLSFIVLCFGFLLFHINPYYAEPYATLKERINLFFWQLYWRPVGTLSIISGCIITFKGLKK